MTHSSDIIQMQNSDSSNPWTLFVISELLMAKNIFKAIHSTLSMIHIAMKDVSSLTRETLNVIRIICENQVPFKWRQVSIS